MAGNLGWQNLSLHPQGYHAAETSVLLLLAGSGGSKCGELEITAALSNSGGDLGAGPEASQVLGVADQKLP